MKHLKKLAGVLLALVMVMALGAPAFASNVGDDVDPGIMNNGDTNGAHDGADVGNSQNQKGTITISNAAVGATYSIYRIFNLESYNRDNNAYLYRINDGWEDFFKAPETGMNYVTIDKDSYVSWKENVSTSADTVQEFAKAALEYANRKNISPVETKKATVPEGSEAATVSLVFDGENGDGLPLGYYLVDSSLGTLCNLNTTDSDVTIQEKNDEPTNDKEVEENSTGEYGDKNDANIGDTVNFRSTITAQAGAANSVFHDKMSKGLTFNGSVEVTLNDNPVLDTNYTLKVKGDTVAPIDDCTFEIEFTKDFCDALKADDKIVISYSAVLNEGAEIAGDGNTNESKLTYGNSGETVFDTTTTYTWEMDIEKVDGDGKTLADATFTLSKKADGSDPIYFVRSDVDVDGMVTYRVATEAEKAAGNVTKYTEITTTDTGKFKLIGLDAGTYYLTEIEAPDGYNKLDEPVMIVIEDANSEAGTTLDTDASLTIGGPGTVWTPDKDDELSPVETVSVLNLSGTRLPSTGGIGTTLFYVVGGVLVLGAVVLLITKRRTSVDDE